MDSGHFRQLAVIVVPLLAKLLLDLSSIQRGADAVANGHDEHLTDDFFKAARDGRLKSDPDDWLPPSLLEKALAKVDESGDWFLRNPNAREPSLVCRMKDGTEVIGRFELDGLDVGKVTTEIMGKKKDRRTERRQARQRRERQPREHRERQRRDRRP